MLYDRKGSMVLCGCMTSDTIEQRGKNPASREPYGFFFRPTFSGKAGVPFRTTGGAASSLFFLGFRNSLFPRLCPFAIDNLLHVTARSDGRPTTPISAPP